MKSIYHFNLYQQRTSKEQIRMTQNEQKKWYEGLTAEQIEAVFAERERKNYAELVAPILPKEQYATCEECGRYCYTGGEHKEGEEYICDDCDEEDVDDRDAPNVYPYKKCSDCGERKSCGSYSDDNEWFCEDCY